MTKLALVGLYEIRTRLGANRQRAHQLTMTPTFPEPVATLAQGRIWLTADFDAWAARYAPATTERTERNASS
jgi:prophage regulatory protein